MSVDKSIGKEKITSAEPPITFSTVLMEALLENEKFINKETGEKVTENKVRDLIALLNAIFPNLQCKDPEKEAWKDLLQKAVDYAVIFHAGQDNRANGEPFIHHVFRAPTRLIEKFGVTDPELISTALLHDSLEDQSPFVIMCGAGAPLKNPGVPPRIIAETILEDLFNAQIMDRVRKLSNNEVSRDTPKPIRNKLYLDKVTEVIADPGIALVKLADFYDNAFTLHELEDPKRRYWQSCKYLPVAEAFIDRFQLKPEGRYSGLEAIPLADEVRADVIKELSEAILSMRSFIANYKETE